MDLERRKFLKGLAAATGLLFLTGCEGLIQSISSSADLKIPTDTPTPDAEQTAINLLKESQNWQEGDTVLIKSESDCGLSVVKRFPQGQSSITNISDSGVQRLYLTGIDTQHEQTSEVLEGLVANSQVVGANIFKQDVSALSQNIRIGMGLLGTGVTYTLQYRPGDIRFTDGRTRIDYTDSFNGGLFGGSPGPYWDPEIVLTDAHLESIEMIACNKQPWMKLPINHSFHTILFHSPDMMNVGG